MSKPRNCRHCSHMVCGDDNWCSMYREVISDYRIWVARKCPDWDWNPIDALTFEEWGPTLPSEREAAFDGQTAIELKGDLE